MKRNLLYLLILATAAAAAQTSKTKPESIAGPGTVDPSSVPGAQAVVSPLAKPTKAKATTSKPYSCVAGPGEECASDLWYADYLKWRDLTDKYKAPQEVQDQINGMALRLNQQIPPGFQWSEVKQRFVKSPPAQAPTNTPVPAEKK